MKKRFLLDRVTLHSGNISPGNVERATVVEANLTDTGLSLGNGAAMAAGIAAHTIAFQLFPEGGVAFADAVVSRQDVAQRGHTHILRRRDRVCLWSAGVDGPVRNRAQFASDFARSL